MAALGGPRSQHAARGLRARGRPRRRGDGDAGPVPVKRVTLYHAADCHLCERARSVLADVRAEIPFQLDEVDISGVPELEARYREWLPVVEVDGERAFTYFVQPAALKARLGAQTRPPETSL